MKDPTLALRMAYYTLISATLPGIKVYDSIVANDAPAKRIILGSQTYDEKGAKDTFGGVATIDIDIASRWPLGSGGGKWNDETATAIMEAVSPTKGTCALAITGFKAVNASAQIIPFPPSAQASSGDYIHRKIIRFTHTIFQT